MPYSRRTGKRYTAGSSTSFADWEPRVCCLCRGPINKARDGAHRFYMDDVSGQAWSWHVEPCEREQGHPKLEGGVGHGLAR